MTAPADPRLDVEDLLRHDGWLRRLAAGLIEQPDADDVAQQTWTAVLQRDSAHSGPARAWLRVVARNFAARHRRARARRATHEARAARPETVPSAEATVHELQTRRALMESIESLPETMRTPLLLRFFHDRSTREIAAHLGLEEATVRQRHKRALDQLRHRLLRRADPRLGAGLLALAQGGAPIGTTATITGVLLMSKTTKLVAAIAVAVALGAGVWTLSRPPTPADLPTDVAAAPQQVPGRAQPATTPTTERPAVRAPIADATPESSGLAVAVTGRVVDPRGAALAGVSLAVVDRLPDSSTPAEPETARSVLAQSGPNGQFSLQTPAERGFVIATGAHATLCASGFGAPRTTSADILVVATLAVDAAGVVVDGEGQPVAGAAIRILEPHLTDYPGVLDTTNDYYHHGCTTDAEGRFALARIPARIATLRVRAQGFAEHTQPTPRTDRGDLRIVLKPEAEAPWVVTGQVLDAGGRLVADALVGLGGSTTQSDSRGRYEIRRNAAEQPYTNTALFAAKPGLRTAVVADVGKRLHAEPSRRIEIDLTLPGEPLSITGRVLDDAGAPVAGALVYLWNRPMLHGDRNAEELSVPESRPKISVGPGIRICAPTAPDGSFTLEGLRDETYALRVLDQKTRAGFTSAPITAGSRGVELRFPPQPVIEELRVTVVDADGQPIEGAQITAQTLAYRTSNGLWSDNPANATTDAEGRATLRDLPRHDTSLHVRCDSIMPTSIGVKPAPDGTQRIVADARCHLRVEIDDATKANGFGIEDAAGKKLDILQLGIGGYSSRNNWPLIEGRSRTLAVRQSGVSLVLFLDHEEVARVPIRLRSGDVNVLRW